MLLSRDVLKSVLKESVVFVTFDKKDGTERIMKCTLKDDVLPPFETTWSNKKVCLSCLSVWDLDKSEWRSFRLDSVKNVSITMENQS
jgi:hypothetical protein